MAVSAPRRSSVIWRRDDTSNTRINVPYTHIHTLILQTQKSKTWVWIFRCSEVSFHILSSKTNWSPPETATILLLLFVDYADQNYPIPPHSTIVAQWHSFSLSRRPVLAVHPRSRSPLSLCLDSGISGSCKFCWMKSSITTRQGC